MKKNTIKNIADKVGVSTATVSRALSGKAGVGGELREKIRSLASSIGYEQLNKRSFQNAVKKICVVVPDMTNPYFHRLFQSLTDYFPDTEYDIFSFNASWSQARELSLVASLRDMSFDALIINPVSDSSIKEIRKMQLPIPTVFVAISTEFKDVHYVTTDDRKAGYIATQYILQLGHRDIIFIGAHAQGHMVGVALRLAGFRQAMAEHHLDLKPEMIVNTPDIRQVTGHAAMLNLIKAKRIPSAIVASNDYVALGVMEALYQNGYRIPDDVSIIGFDDIDISSFPAIGLTTIKQPVYEMGKTICDIIMNELAGKANVFPTQYIFEASLTIRKSCKPYTGQSERRDALEFHEIT